MRTRAIGRCSTAPADALQTAGVTSADAPLGNDHARSPRPPRRSGDRAQVLRVGDLVERDEQRVLDREQVRRVNVRIRVDERRDALMRFGPRPLLDLLGGDVVTFASPPCPGSVAQMRWTLRRPRSASSTGWTP